MTQQANGLTGRVLPDLSKAFGGPAPVQSIPPKSDKLKWSTLDMDSLSPDLQELYLSYAQAEDTAIRHRKMFEAAMRSKLDIPSHLILRFGYRYPGKIGVALDVDARSKQASSVTLEGLANMIDKNVR